jgi:ribosome-associated heat shock protein Hsp15
VEKYIRIDKWLWAVRIFKTRSLAAEACKKKKVAVNGVSVKSSKLIKVNDIVSVIKLPVTYTYRVIELIQKRISAKLVPEYIENQTPEAEMDKLIHPKQPVFGTREKGAGRPTKKERRTLDNLRTKL